MTSVESDEMENRLKNAHYKLRALLVPSNAFHSVLEHDEWNEPHQGIKTKICCLSDEEQTSLDVIFTAGAKMPRHYHVTNKEIIFVVSGYLIDEATNTFWPHGSVYTIVPGKEHELHAPHGAKLKVIFEPALTENPN